MYYLTEPKYKKIKIMGSGASGQTYLVEEKDSKNRFVLKEIKLTDSNSAKVNSEISILKKIKKYGCDSSLLCLHKYYIDYETFTMNIITDLFENSQTLAEYIRNYKELEVELKKQDPDTRGFLDRRDFLVIMKNLMEALVYLHKIGIAHGDLKPENILINNNLDIQIIDFGSACSKSCKYIPTLLYTAPEMITKIQKKVDLDSLQMSDVYAMGMILYLLGNFSFPFDLKMTRYHVQEELDSEDLLLLDDKSELSGELSGESNVSEKSFYELFGESIDSDKLFINLESDFTKIITLMEFYKKKENSIESSFNENDTKIDVMINRFIELMLKSYKKTNESRLSSKRLFGKLQGIIKRYNKTVENTTQIIILNE